MAAGLGFIEFTTGDVLSAAAANGYLASQSVMVFATAAARTSAIASPQEGMISFLKDSDTLQFYTGAAWSNVDTGASPLTTKGDVYGYSTTNARLAVGTNNQVLTADSAEATGLKWATPASTSGMTLIGTPTTFTASSSVTVDSVFSATYDNYQIILSNTGSAADDLAMQFRTSAVTNTTSNYNTQELQADNTTVSSSRQGPVSTGIRVSKTNTVRCYSTIFLQNPFAALPTGAQSLILNNSETLPGLRYHVGNFGLTTSFDGLRLVPSTGTITGTVTIYGMAKS